MARKETQEFQFVVYNTMTQQKEVFKPKTPGKVHMYVCGVTAYDFSHLGHARAAVSFDVFYRVLARYSICLLTRVLGYAFLGVLVSKKTEEELANLNIIDEEEVAFREETLVVEDDYKLCVVG
ncbi:hypothetical protein Gotur_034377 [Gossypium turneri]